MNRTTLFFAALMLLFSACKTTKKMAQSEYTTDNTTSTKVFTVPGSETTPQTTTPKVKETPVVTETPVVADEKPIAIKKEQVSFTNPQEKVQNIDNSYFVIIGSFSQLSNAKTYHEKLRNEGFTPIILHSETGYFRVCVNSYKNETEARSRIARIRHEYKEYADVWLLIKE